MFSSVPRVALVGLGGYARVHLTQLQTLHSAGLCQLVAVAEPFMERHGEVIAALRNQGICVHEAVETLLQNESVDAVFLATPIHLHARHTIAALDAGKHVYLEKPPCASLQEWHAMRAAQQRAGKVCVVGFQMQSHSAMRFLRHALFEGEIGQVQRVWASVRWRRTDDYYARSPWAGRYELNGEFVFDGPATNALAHVVHGALSLASNSPEVMPELVKARGILKRARPIQSYDSSYLEARTRQGCEIRLAFTHATAFHDEVLLHCTGEKGGASINWNGTVHLNERVLQFPCEAGAAATLDFLCALGSADCRPSVTLQDTLPYMQMVNAARESFNGTCGFDVALIERHESGFFSVANLDEQLSAFAADFEAQPSLLSADGREFLDCDAMDLPQNTSLNLS
jgi:predicted dehydrogenase